MTDLAVEFREQLRIFQLMAVGPLQGLLPPMFAGHEAVAVVLAERPEGTALPEAALDGVLPTPELGFDESEWIDRQIQNTPPRAAFPLKSPDPQQEFPDKTTPAANPKSALQ